jgi:hypothetical protein
MATQTKFRIGTTSGGMVTLESLGIPDPKWDYQSYAQAVPLGSGLVRGLGGATARWRWAVLSQADRNSLRTYCTGASAAVYIETRTTEKISSVSDQFDEFTANMTWTELEDIQGGRRVGFEIIFKNLVAF